MFMFLVPSIVFRKSTARLLRRHVLAQSQQWKHQSNVKNFFKVKNKNTRMTSLTTSFRCLYC